MTKPFFSVCVPVYNGAKVILNALDSLNNQTYKNFEVIIIDDDSSDNSFEIIKLFLKNKKSSYFLKKNDRNLGMVHNWKKILEPAKGKYIAILHQDDIFLPNHLEMAYDILNKFKNIGIYSVGNQFHHRRYKGLISPRSYFKSIYKFEDVSPPSETIFIREHKKKKYLYNYKEYVYCPEAELYLKIVNDNYNVYHNNTQSVVRGSELNIDSVTSKMAYTWIYFIDKFKLIEKYKSHRYIGKKIYQKSLNIQINIAIQRYIDSLMLNKGKPYDLFSNIKKVLLEKRKYIKYFGLVFLRFFANFNLLRFLIQIRAKIFFSSILRSLK